MSEGELIRATVSNARAFIRISLIAAIYFFVPLALNAGFLKSAICAVVAFLLGAAGAGKAIIEPLAICTLVLFLADWTQLLPIGQWLHAIIGLISHALGSSTA